MIHNIAPHSLNNRFVPGVKPSADDMCICFRGRDIIVADGDGIRFPAVGDMPRGAHLQWLFTLDGGAVFLDTDDEQPPKGFVYVPLRSLRGKEPKHLVFSAWTAIHLAEWYRRNRFCGTCGHKTVPAPDERALDCPSCGRRIYPRLQPAVIVGVTYGDNLLLTHYADRPLASWAMVAGFAEIGETLEETVAREVMEETGLHVSNIRYYKSQPWGIEHDLLSGFYCDVTGDPTVYVDNIELREAVWTPREQITGQADDLSLTNEMMMVFKAGLEPK